MQDAHIKHGQLVLYWPRSTLSSLERITGNHKYTDKMIFTLEDSTESGQCKIEACSHSQVTSVADFGTNYCNLKMLYCGTKDGCKPVSSDFAVSDENTSGSVGATVDLKGCLKV